MRPIHVFYFQFVYQKTLLTQPKKTRRNADSLNWEVQRTRMRCAQLKIDHQQPEVMTLQRVRRARDKDIQSVFSEVLNNAGRAGYVSAEQAETSEPLDVRIEEAWNRWYQTELLGRYASKEAPQDLGRSYGEVLSKAYQEGAYVDPKTFLKGLSRDELKSVQNAHWLADEIQVGTLTEEGALNLLIPPAAQVDLNGDGLTRSGEAFGIRFPDSRTEPNVVAAWEEATDGMPLSERMVYELNMKLPVLLANLVTDADGRFVSSREPGDPDFVNPMLAEDYSFVQVAQNWIGHLEYFKNQMDPSQYAKGMEFWETFHQSLRDNGAT